MGFWRQQIYPYPLASLGQFHKESSVSFGYEQNNNRSVRMNFLNCIIIYVI